MSNRANAKCACGKAKRSATKRLLKEGGRVARDLLRSITADVGVDLTELSLVLVHENARTVYAKLCPELVDLGIGWSFDLVDAPKVVPIAPNRTITPPKDTAVVLINTDGGGMVELVPFTDLLPPPADLGKFERRGKGYLLTLKQAVWLFFLSGEKDLRPNLRRLHRDFHDVVRSTVASELARPGRKRSLSEIVFALAGGDGLRTAGRDLAEEDVPALVLDGIRDAVRAASKE